MNRAGIIGIGKALPDLVVTNDDLGRLVDTSDEWIRTRTGIRERRIIGEGQAVSDLAAAAARAAVDSADLALEDIDFILVASASPEAVWPSTACLTQRKLGVANIPALDIQAACSGFSYGLALAATLVEGGSYKNVLFVCGEAMSRYLDWSDRNTCVLFGDGAAAVVVAPVEKYGIIYSYLGADGRGSDSLRITSYTAGYHSAPGVCSPPVVNMNGREVYRFAVRVVQETVAKVLSDTGVGLADIDYLLLHQANQRITDQIAEQLSLPPERVPGNLDRYGNTSTASIPLLMEELASAGKLASGSKLLCVGFGAGLTWGANLLEWW